MKNLILLFVAISLSIICRSQDTTAVPEKRSVLSHFQIYGDVNTDHLLNHPGSIKFSIPKSRGGGIYARYEIPFGASKFGISPAFGICSYDLSSNGAITYVTDTISGKTSTGFNLITTKFKLNKMVANYVEVPLEFFYSSKTSIPFRIGLGFKGGYLVSSHTKFKPDGTHKDKSYYIKNLMLYRYGPTVRVSYGWFGLVGYYSLSPLFEKNLGPDSTPFSVGITIAPY